MVKKRLAFRRRRRFFKKRGRMSSYPFKNVVLLMGKTLKRNIEIVAPIYAVFNSSVAGGYTFDNTPSQTAVTWTFNIMNSSTGLVSSAEYQDLWGSYEHVNIRAITLEFVRTRLIGPVDISGTAQGFVNLPPMFLGLSTEFNANPASVSNLLNYAKTDNIFQVPMLTTDSKPTRRTYMFPPNVEIPFSPGASGGIQMGKDVWCQTRNVQDAGLKLVVVSDGLFGVAAATTLPITLSAGYIRVIFHVRFGLPTVNET